MTDKNIDQKEYDLKLQANYADGRVRVAEPLLKNGLITQEEMDKLRADAKAAHAALDAYRAGK